jgi:hypothetical protein
MDDHSCRIGDDELMKRYLLAIFALMFGMGEAFSQSRQAQNFQLWLDYDPNYPMGKWTFDLEISPHFGSGESKWSEINVTPNWEYAATTWLDLGTGVGLSYAHQTEDYDTFEANPYVLIRPYYFTKRGVRGIKLVDQLRFDYRAQYTIKTGERANSGRIRNRIQAWIPINKNNILVPGNWHAIVDVEAFYNFKDLDERFSSRLRIRAGAGYRHSNAWRYQLIFTLQRARDTIEEDFNTTDIILNFRAIHFF